ncbi:MAG: hypothetical protein A2785_02935 [Candidatus Chisholmbacteria bacterium RIFCSPHIGHO2_01_FULL_49_18]|nr:MAG: hypothetical protein A2785_02935 [Candidatus Chisholmbacteria bacterium RIFCSPHIGHO2_01_FULL_49_18]
MRSELDRLRPLSDSGMESFLRIDEAIEWWKSLPEKRLDLCASVSLVALFGKWVMEYFDAESLREGRNFFDALAVLSVLFRLDRRVLIASAEELAQATLSPAFVGGFVLSHPFGQEAHGHMSTLLPGHMIVPEKGEVNAEDGGLSLPVREVEGLIMFDPSRDYHNPEEVILSYEEVYQIADQLGPAPDKKVIFLLYSRGEPFVSISPTEEVRTRLEFLLDYLRERGEGASDSGDSSGTPIVG